MDPLQVIKIGGNIVDDEGKLSSFHEKFSAIQGSKILVHGGGKIATHIGNQLGIESKYIDGRRITDAATIDLVTMVYAGLINKKIVAKLQAFGCNAFGVTGADGNLIPAGKRPIKDGIDYGFVGDVKSANIPASSWKALLDNGFVPIVAPITHDGNGQLLNTNADTIAQEIAKALAKQFEVTLIYCFEKKGVLLDINNEESVVTKLTPAVYEQLKKEEKIFAGMLPKLDNSFAALHAGVAKVVIGSADDLGANGTMITHE